jgi:hypothetical protein
MTTVYFSEHNKRRKEKMFFQHLIKELKDFKHINHSFPLSESLFLNYIDVPLIIKFLIADYALPVKRKQQAIDELSRLPKKVMVAKTIIKVSVDITIQKDDKLYFVEFHEK